MDKPHQAQLPLGGVARPAARNSRRTRGRGRARTLGVDQHVAGLVEGSAAGSDTSTAARAAVPTDTSARSRPEPRAEDWRIDERTRSASLVGLAHARAALAAACADRPVPGPDADAA